MERFVKSSEKILGEKLYANKYLALKNKIDNELGNAKWWKLNC